VGNDGDFMPRSCDWIYHTSHLGTGAQVTIRELVTQLISNKRIDWNMHVFVYDPAVKGYVKATGIAILPNGAVEMQSPD